MPQVIELKLPKLHSAQREIMLSHARFNVLACGRRFGKSTLGLNLCAEIALDKKKTAYFAPTYRMLMDAWRYIVAKLKPVSKKVNASEKRIELITGGVIEFWSLDNPDAVRGRKYHRCIIDEAAAVVKLEEAWNQVIRPLLTDFLGDCWFLSTPKGGGFFKRIFERGQDSLAYPEWKSWRKTTYDNPFIKASEIDQARAELPQDVFEQEYLSEFKNNVGSVFHRVRHAIADVFKKIREKGHKYVAGLDLAKVADFTVLSIFDTSVNPVQLVHTLRFNQIDWKTQIVRVQEAFKKFRFSKLVVDATGGQNTMVEALKDAIPNTDVIGVTFTNSLKEQLILNLVMGFERDEIQIYDEPVMINELESFERKVSPTSGRSIYNAPSDGHDDFVSSLILGWHAVTSLFDNYQVLSLFNIYDSATKDEEYDPEYWKEIDEYYSDNAEEDEELEAEIDEYYSDETDKDEETESDEENTTNTINPKRKRSNAAYASTFSTS